MRIGRSGVTSDGRGHVAPEHLLVVDDLHAPAAQDVGRPDHERIADPLGDRQGLVEVAGHADSGMGMPSFSIILRKRSRSSARSIVSGEVPRILTPASASSPAMFSGVWPPNWTMTPSGFSFS